jgi:hypothetical protein
MYTLYLLLINNSLSYIIVQYLYKGHPRTIIAVLLLGVVKSNVVLPCLIKALLINGLQISDLGPHRPTIVPESRASIRSSRTSPRSLSWPTNYRQRRRSLMQKPSHGARILNKFPGTLLRSNLSITIMILIEQWVASATIYLVTNLT